MSNVINNDNINIELKKESINLKTQFQNNLVDSLLPNCDYQHLLNCDCQHDLILRFKHEAYEESLKDNDVKEIYDDNEPLFLNVWNKIKSKALHNAADYCTENHIKCKYQEDELNKTVIRFNNKYDLDDPRVYEIVNNLLMSKSDLIRANIYSHKHGMLQRVYDKNENSSFVLNPIERLKVDLSKLTIDAIEKLDRIIEGSKNVNINVNSETVSMDEFMDKFNTK